MSELQLNAFHTFTHWYITILYVTPPNKCLFGESLCEVVANVLNSDIVVSEFELILRLPTISDKYLWEKYELPYSSSLRSDSTITVLQG